MRHIVAVVLLALAGGACGGGAGPLGAAPTDDGPAASVAELESVSLEDFGCGYGFTIGTPDQTVRLSLWSDTGFGNPPEEGTHELGGTWTGELVTGRNLFAQWCDDVVGPDEPEVVEEASWEVAGTLTWELVEGEGQCPSVAMATLSDGTVRTDGETIELPPIDLRNEFFGCFAG